MRKKHLDSQFIILVFLFVFCVISYAIDSKENKCSSSFNSSLISLLKKYSHITRDEKYTKDQSNIPAHEQELIDKSRERISTEEPHRVLEIILNKKEGDIIRESAIELLSEILIDFNDLAIKQKYTNKETVTALNQIFFDKTNNDRIRGEAVIILCFFYTKMDIGNVPVLFLRQLKKILFDKNESEIVKRDIIEGLNLIKAPSVINMLKEIIVDKKQPESVQIPALQVLAESKTSNPEIIDILISKLLNVPVEELNQQHDMTMTTVKTLYALTARDNHYKPIVEELINIIFFGMRIGWQASTSLKIEVIPPLDWSLGSLQTYRPLREMFNTMSEDAFINIDSLMKRARNQTFLTLEYSTTFSLVHTLYLMLFNKKEPEVLRIKALHRLYVENHFLFPYILAGIISDQKESELIKFISLLIMQNMEAMESLFSSAVQPDEKSPIELGGKSDHSSNKENKTNKTSDTQTAINGENEELVLKEARERGLKKMYHSSDPRHQQFLTGLSQPEVIKNSLSEFIANSENKDPIIKGLMLYALNEWGMLNNTRLAEIAVNSGVVNYNIRLMAIKKLMDNLTELKHFASANGTTKDSPQYVNTSIVENLVKIFTDSFEDPSVRELSAEALFRIQPPDSEIQQRLITALFNEKNVIIQDVIHHFQWIKNLPTNLRPPDNMVKIK